MYDDLLECENNKFYISYEKNNTTTHIDIDDNIWEDTDCTGLSEWNFL